MGVVVCVAWLLGDVDRCVIFPGLLLAMLCCFCRVVSWCLVPLIGLLRRFPCFCFVCFGAFWGVLFFFVLILWRRGSIPRRSWRLGAPPFLAYPFRDIAHLSLCWGLDVMSESHCTNPTGGLLIRLKHKKNSGFPSTRINLSPFTKDFHGGEQLKWVYKLIFRRPAVKRGSYTYNE